MKTASLSEIKKDLRYKSKEELQTLCLQLAKFKKESKEYLTYLLFEADNEDLFISTVKQEISDLFQEMNTDSFFYVKKSTRKILRLTKKYIRFSKQKQTEVELLLHFTSELLNIKPNITQNTVLKNMYLKQLEMAQKAASKLHPDIQFEYENRFNGT
ncbi:MAG: hypothetical protein R3279_05715 [Putridiphycobacter sp.]|nr:hypothetical protein [Putridiphycobacter sp.]